MDTPHDGLEEVVPAINMAIFGIYVRFLGNISVILVWPSYSLNAIMPSCLFLYLSHYGSMGRLYIYRHEWLIFMVNVGKYTIHGCYGYVFFLFWGVRRRMFHFSDKYQKSRFYERLQSCMPHAPIPADPFIWRVQKRGVFKGRGSLGNPKDS